jgi:uncharacterized protein
MTLKEQLDADLRAAMRAGDETRKSALRMLITAVRNAEIPAEGVETAGVSRRELDDEAVLNVVRKEVKQRRDSIDIYQKANRSDLVSREEAEVAVLSSYLPQQLSRGEIEAVAREVIARVGATGPADKGKVMPVVIDELRGRAEGREINTVVSELLS